MRILTKGSDLQRVHALVSDLDALIFELESMRQGAHQLVRVGRRPSREAVAQLEQTAARFHAVTRDLAREWAKA